MEPTLVQFEADRRTFSVSELSAAIRDLFEAEFGSIWISGEISGAKLASSGHCYFTLKDDDAALKCVCFRNVMRMLRFRPQDGMAVLARGRVDVYAQRGEYQLIVETLEPQGHGALQLAFEQLKKRLAEEGLFDPERKRALPRFPRRVGIVTSPTGAVIQDMLNVLERRHPGLHIRLYPAMVQGDGSAAAVCEGIEYFGREPWADVLIVARGGGSLEDLWTFNEEPVARAIAASPIPVISAVGHETDFTIADFVADLRAPTPSAAAELLIPTRDSLLDLLTNSARSLTQSVRYRLGLAERRLQRQGIERAVLMLNRCIQRYDQRVDDLDSQMKESLRKRLLLRSKRLQDVGNRLQRLDLRVRLVEGHRRLETADAILQARMQARLAKACNRLEPLRSQLIQLSPLAILNRGYSIVETADGRVVKNADEAPAKSALRIRLARGRLQVKVTESTPVDNSELLW